jgi:hypothetical protein
VFAIANAKCEQHDAAHFQERFVSSEQMHKAIEHDIGRKAIHEEKGW